MPTPSGAALSARELSAWRGMLAAHSRLVATLDAELEREHGIGLATYEVLLQLADAPDGSLRMGDLAERLYLSRSGLTRMVDRLTRAGLVERVECESDRRGAYAHITDRGRRSFDAARRTHLRGIRAHFLSLLEPEDLDRLTSVWERVGDPDDRRCG